jgi:hypothetical protein
MKISAPTFKVHLAISVGIEQFYDPLHQRVLLQVVYLHEFFFTQRARSIDIQLSESFAKTPDFIIIDFKRHVEYSQ